jgi:carboxypeptidase C (cathepsin A)
MHATLAWLLLLLAVVIAQNDRVTYFPGYGSISEHENIFAGNIPISNNKRSGSMFYLFFEKQNGDANTPLLLWLNGGPRCSSLLGAFVERISPFYLNETGQLSRNEYGWTKAAHVLFVDNPIGTGFSTVDNDASYAVSFPVFAFFI